MSRYETRQEVANKADWEGGWHEFLFGYGFNSDYCPDDETRAAFEEVERLSEPFHAALDRFTDLFPEPGEEYDE